MQKTSIYFPGLNGLRAIAAIAVVLSHITIDLQYFGLNSFIFGTTREGTPIGFALAGYGVSLFFVLSGFLITYLLLKEKETGTIDIKKFYLRRLLRIWPLYYLYLIIVVLVILIAGGAIKTGTLLLYIFYAANIPTILRTTIPMLGHYWSLGIEEQFYLFWPWVIRKINRWLVPILMITIISLLGIKIVLHFFYSNPILERAFQILRFHSLMIGGLAAVLYKQQNALFLKLVDNKWVQAICWTMLLVLMINKFHFASVIDDDLVSLVSIAIVIGQINVRNRLINLEVNWMDFLGKISYGIYVIHPLLLYAFRPILRDLPLPSPFNYLVIYIILLGVTIIVSWLSYNYFEKYFLRLKEKFTVVKSASSRKRAMQLDENTHG